MFFRDILGKEKLKNDLRRTVDQNKIPHAQILLAKEGYGGLPMALAYASYIMCNDRQDGDSCGKCSQCLKSHKWIHPDVHFSFPVVKLGTQNRAETTSTDYLIQWRKLLAQDPFFGQKEWLDHIEAGNSLPNINVKECNEIMKRLTMMSFESEKKVLIMWLPEYLEKEGNRLLKLIEEPTDNTFIIMVSENQERILQTIISRCRIVKVPAFESDEIVIILKEKYQTPDHQAHQIANMSEGNINLALRISKEEGIDYSDMLISWLRIAYKSDPLEINAWIDGFTKMSKEEQKNYFEYGLHFLRQYNFRYFVKDGPVLLTAKELEIAQKMEKIITDIKTEEIAEILEKNIDLIQRNINMRIMLFATTLQVGVILRNK